MTTATDINFADFATDMIAEADAFDARAEADASVACISSTPWAVTAIASSLAIRVDHNDDGTINLVSVHVTPTLCGFSLFSKQDAEAIAEARGDGFEVVLANRIPTIRSKSLRAGAKMIADQLASQA